MRCIRSAPHGKSALGAGPCVGRRSNVFGNLSDVLAKSTWFRDAMANKMITIWTDQHCLTNWQTLFCFRCGTMAKLTIDIGQIDFVLRNEIAWRVGYASDAGTVRETQINAFGAPLPTCILAIWRKVERKIWSILDANFRRKAYQYVNKLGACKLAITHKCQVTWIQEFLRSCLAITTCGW